MNVIEVAETFCAAWSSQDAEAFSSLFAPDGYYTDMAFGVTRRGRENVREHHKIWRMAVPEFSMMPEHAHASGQVVTVQTICYGKFSGSDLGGSKIKATHKSFRARAIAVLEINDQAEITAWTEYYDQTTMPIGEPTPFSTTSLGRKTNCLCHRHHLHVLVSRVRLKFVGEDRRGLKFETRTGRQIQLANTEDAAAVMTSCFVLLEGFEGPAFASPGRLLSCSEKQRLNLTEETD